MKNEKTTKKDEVATNKNWNSSKTPGNKAGVTSDRSPEASTRDKATQADLGIKERSGSYKDDLNQRSQVNSGKFEQTVNDDGDNIIPSEETVEDDEDDR